MVAKPHPPVKPVETEEELQELLLAGLDSGSSRPMTERDWSELERRAGREAKRQASG